MTIVKKTIEITKMSYKFIIFDLETTGMQFAFHSPTCRHLIPSVIRKLM